MSVVWACLFWIAMGVAVADTGSIGGVGEDPQGMAPDAPGQNTMSPDSLGPFGPGPDVGPPPGLPSLDPFDVATVMPPPDLRGPNDPTAVGKTVSQIVAQILAMAMGPAGLAITNPLGVGIVDLALAGHGSPTDPSVAANPAGISSVDPSILAGMTATMTPQSVQAAVAPGGTLNPGTGEGLNQSQRANAAARFGGGISPAFMENLTLLDSLR